MSSERSSKPLPKTAETLALDGRISVVTGASRGIGAATALELARAGSAVALLDVDVDAASATSDAIVRETGSRARGYGVDVLDRPRMRAIFSEIAADFGAIDHLVNNAGIQYIASVADFPDEKWDLVRGVDLDGVFNATKAVWPYLVARKRGRIVNIASVHGLVASEFKPAYIAAKHGVVGLTKASALEGAAQGITVNAVCPGAVMTELIRGQAKDLVTSYGGGMTEDEALARAFLSKMPTQRFIEPQEVGALCAFLCTDSARSITGAAIAIDGGWTAH